jgi:hypothetical protein
MNDLDAAVADVVAFLRTADPDAAADLAELRRRQVTRPSIVLVGETKRGKSSLLNALLGAPGLSPVDAAAATSTYLHFSPGAAAATAYTPEPVPVAPADLAGWATGPRRAARIEVTHPAPLLQYVTLLDTPGAGGLDDAHTVIALDAVDRATALLFVADAAAPLSHPEVQFLAAAAERVDTVVFALTKVDAYPGWRQIADDNRALLQAHAPRFATAAWFPVSALLAAMASTGGDADLADASGVPALQHALVGLAGHGHQLQLANVLRAARGDLTRLDTAAAARVAATDADPAQTARVREQRAALAARKRTEARQWTLLLSSHVHRARVDVAGRLRTLIAGVQQDVAARIDAGGRDTLTALPEQLDAELQAAAVTLSQHLHATFRQVADAVLTEVFDPGELEQLLGRLNATLRHTLASAPPRDGSADNLLIALSAGGIAFMAGRGAVLGASVLGAGSVAAAGLLVPVAGIGLGLAAGGYVLYRRRVQTDRQQARLWLRDVLGEARAALSDEISHRFTDLQYALSVAVDDAVERRLRELDAHIADIDAAAASDAAGRARRRAAAQADRDRIRAHLDRVDTALARAGARTRAPEGTPS